MAEWYEPIIEIAHIGVIVALIYLGYWVGAFFIFLFWIYYHRTTIKNILVKEFGARNKDEDDKIYSEKWSNYLREYKKLKNWVTTKNEVESEKIDPEKLINSLLTIRSNQIQNIAMVLGVLAILLAFLAIVYASASLYLTDPTFTNDQKKFLSTLALITGIALFFLMAILINRNIKKI